MTHEHTRRGRRKEPGDKPFPWRCPVCLEQTVVPAKVPYTGSISHDGRQHSVTIHELTVPKCQSCGEVLFNGDADDQITKALRGQLKLLMPAEIREFRKSLKMRQKELARQLGTAEATLSRWETGALIQSRAMDNLMRTYFTNSNVREALKDRANGVAEADSLPNSCERDFDSPKRLAEKWQHCFPSVASTYDMAAIRSYAHDVAVSGQLLPIGRD